MMGSTRSTLRLIGAPLAALPLALTACDNSEGVARNKAEERLSEAAREIHNYSLGSAYPTPMTDEQSEALTSLASSVASSGPPEGMSAEQAQSLSRLSGKHRPIEAQQASLQKIQSGLAGAGGGLTDQQAAQAALRAEANLGLARLRLEEADRSEARLSREIILASAHIDAVLDLQAIIASNAAYDPAAPLRHIDNQAQDARTRLARYQTEARDLQKRLSDLKARIDAEVRETNRLGEEAARQREAARTAPLDQRIALAEGAAAVSRKADAHQVAAARLEAEVGVLQPELVRAQTHVLEAEGELKDLDAARARIKARQDEVAKEARQLEGDLRQAIEAFHAIYTPLAQRFEGELMARFDAAREAADAAVREARSAGAAGAGRTAGAQQTLGQILWRQSMSIDQFAQLVRRVAAHGRALGRSGQDAAAADALEARAQAARDAAAEILREALGSVEGSGRTAEERERHNQLAALLRDSIEYITGEAVAEVRDFSDLGEITPMIEDTAPIGAGESPLALLRNAKAVLEGGRLADIPGLFHAKTPEQQTGLNLLNRVCGAAAKLETAARDRFGVGLVDIGSDPRFAEQLNSLTGGMGGGIDMRSAVAGNPLDVAGLAEIGDLSSIDLDTIEFMYDNSRTTAWTDDVPGFENQNFVLVGGQWYFEAPELPEEASPMISTFLDPVVAAVENVAERTGRGEFVDQWLMISALIEEIGRVFEEEFRKMMPTGGGMFDGFDPSKFGDPSRGGGN